MAKVWSKRFDNALNPFIEKFNASISFDRKLILEDLDCSIAHAKMLGKTQVLSASETLMIINALEKIKKSNVLFLLDDIFSYLDIRFIRNIMDRLDELKLQTWMTDVRLDSIHQIEKFKSKIHNINIDDNRFKVLNN